jgi:hypothetical protein
MVAGKASMKTVTEDNDHVPDEFSQARAVREKLIEGKKKMRKRRAALSFTEKIKILEKLRDRSEKIAASGLRHAFIKASREARFLFDKDSGVQTQLDQIHADSFGIIGFRRDIAQNPGFSGPDILPPNNEFLKRLERVHSSISPLEEAMSKYLNFHAVSAWW